MSHLNPAQFPAGSTYMMPMRSLRNAISGDHGGPMSGVPGIVHRDPGMRYDHKDMRELTDSVREHGVREPLAGAFEPGGHFEVWDGHHRYVAAHRAKATHVPVTVHQSDMTPDDLADYYAQPGH